jgi:hypothetical protein
MWKLHRYYYTEIVLTAALTFVVLFGIAIVYACDFLARQLLRAFDAPAVAFLPAGVLLALSTPMCWRVVRS